METLKSPNAAAGAGGPTFEPYIDKAEVGRRLGIRPRTVDAWLKNGMLVFFKLGGRSVRFKWSEVEAHLAANYRVCRRNKVK